MRILSLCALYLGVSATAILPGVADAKSNAFEGTWKLSKPQTLLTPTNGEPVPFTDAGRQLYEESKAAAAKGDYRFDETLERCGSPGTPRIMLSPQRFKLFDMPGKVTFIFEWNRQSRQIDTRDDTTVENSKPLPGSPEGFPSRFAEQTIVGSHMGQARGRWEGDKVLVVETGHFVDYKLLDGLIHTSDELQLSERFRLKDKNTLEHRIVISDPVTFTRPWETVLTYERQADADFQEDVCMDRQKLGEAIWPKP